MEKTLLAFSPDQLVESQKALIVWCDQKIEEHSRERKDLEENLQTAVRQGWRHHNFESLINKATKRILAYEKVKEAVIAGYYVVPNFPIDVFAVRTAKLRPEQKKTDRQWENRDANAQLLPPGHGKYVALETEQFQRNYPERQQDGKAKDHWYYWAESFKEVAFPIAIAKPEIIEATAKALSLKVFDEVGLVGTSKQNDPMIIGRIYSKKGSRQEKFITFFIAWWLDYAAL